MSAEAPEADKVLGVQAAIPFQILIPAYLPKEFDRGNVQIKVSEDGPSGEPMVQLDYRTSTGAVLTLREWVPGDPGLEILASSHPIETKWGKGWLLRRGNDLIALWVDVGPLRVSIHTREAKRISREQMLGMAQSLGPASNRQVFNFMLEQPTIKAAAPAPPVEIAANAEGIQAFDLIITPGGYSPLRFAVKKGVPVKLTFRQLGEVGCGNELILARGTNNSTSLRLSSPADRRVMEFTPQETGAFEFHCSHIMYRGVMVVHD